METPAAEAILRRAIIAARAGRWEETLTLLEPVTQAEDASQDACVWHARALFALGDEAAAEKALRRATVRFGGGWAGARMLREMLIADGRTQDALSLLPSTSAQGPDQLGAALAAHAEGDYREAARLCRDVLAQSPRDARALNHLARALHNLGQRDVALATFREAVTAAPDYAEAWQNLGHALRARGHFDAARDAYQRALSARPAFRAARRSLAKAHLLAERPQLALDTLAPLLERDPHDVEARIDRGLALHQLGRLQDALDSYRGALEDDPRHASGWYYHGAALNEAGRSAEAREALERALSLEPRDADAWAELAACHEADNRLDEVERTLQRARATTAATPRLAFEGARLARRRGRPAEALQILQRLPAEALHPRQRAAYWFERARTLDAVGQYDDAFAAFDRANRTAAANARHADATVLPQVIAATQRWLASPRDRSDWTPGAQTLPAPIFLLGFPRSGITLLNVILGCHPAFATLEEKPTVEHCVAHVAQLPGGYPDALDVLDPAGVAALRLRYWREAESHGYRADRGQLIDMFPLRSLYAPLIARLFPGATVVFVHRHPGDVVLSNFFQHYEANSASAHFRSLADTVSLYAGVVSLWQTARETLPLDVIDVRYEALVLEPEATLTKLLQRLDVPWNPRVLDHTRHMNHGMRVTTSSYHQVAEPVHRNATGRWKHYRRALEPFLDALQPVAKRNGYTF